MASAIMSETVGGMAMEGERNTTRITSVIMSETVGGKAMEGETNTTRITSVIMSETVGRKAMEGETNTYYKNILSNNVRNILWQCTLREEPSQINVIFSRNCWQQN